MFADSWLYAGRRRLGGRAGAVLHLPRGAGARGRRPRRGHAPERVRQHLPPPGDRGRAGPRQADDLAVPVPRLDVRAERLPARHAPRSEREPGFDPDDYGLLPVGVDDVGAVRVRQPQPGRAAAGDLPGPAAADPGDAGIDFDRLRYRDRSEWEVAANWKAVVENYLECYHCPTAHPGLLEGDRRRPRRVPPDVGRVVLQPDLHIARGRPSARDLPYNPDGEIAEAHFHWLWPTFTINVFPGRPTWRAVASCPLAPAGR